MTTRDQHQRYNRSEKGRARSERYSRSEKGYERSWRYERSGGGRDTRRRYDVSAARMLSKVRSHAAGAVFDDGKGTLTYDPRCTACRQVMGQTNQ